MELRGKVVLVTGSSSGIGQAIAVECAREGAKVLIHYRKNGVGAEKTLKEVKKYSDGKVFQADLEDAAEIEKFFREIKSYASSIDVLISNAGRARRGEPDDFKLWQKQFNNIFFSAVNATNEFLKTPPKQKRIIYISSVYGIPEMGAGNFPQFSAAKAALNSLACTLAKKLAPNVLVNAIAPGYVLTPLWEGVSKEGLDSCANLTRIKRMIRPDEVASLAVQLIKNDAITGEIVRIDGGLHLSDI